MGTSGASAIADTDGAVQAVILAAGKGTRMRSELPKVLHRLCGQTLIERALRSVLGVAPKRVVVVVGFGAERVRAEVEAVANGAEFRGVEIVCVEQREQRGTGHATQIAFPELCAEFSEVLILPGDAPLLDGATLAEFASCFRRDATHLSLISCSPPDPAAFGRIVRNAEGHVSRIVERQDCSPEELAIGEINSSVYFARYDFLKEALPQLSDKNSQHELYLTDIVAYATSRGSAVTAFSSLAWQKLVGANTRSELSELERIRRLELCRHWMDRGVTFEDSERTYLEESVTIGADSLIGAGARLHGAVTIGTKVLIEGESWLTNVSIGDGSRIRPSCVIEDTAIGKGCSIGPFAHLRPGTTLCDNVRIGNFVETKKAILGEGSKASHLTYLGDATIGADVNIGAGTITCNYDGTVKNQTIIEDGVFIGSNSCLVAPVTIGRGGYVGAGSTITNDVPADSLGVGRARQRNIEGWAAKRQRAQE